MQSNQEGIFVKNDVLWSKLKPVTDPRSQYAGFRPGNYILKKGTVIKEGYMPLPCDILCERDQTIVLRDGIKLYCDVYRPPYQTRPVPAIMNWGPGGKQGRHDIDIPGMPEEKGDFPKSAVSNLQVNLCNDPAPWLNNGYAVVSVDPRGVYMSEGDMHYFGDVDALDGCDAIAWIASRDWCNGNVGMAGNAYIAIEQWFIASKHPPALKAIAPWEGHADFYREEFVIGGIPKKGNPEDQKTFGSGCIEYIAGMPERFPYFNDYWASKRVDPALIKTPAYVVASYDNSNHVKGTFDMFRGLGTEEKWLRVHNTASYHDFRVEENRLDLQKFFDYYLKGIENDWPETPRVRLSVLDHGWKDIVGRVEESFPLERQQLTRLYLSNNGRLRPRCQKQEAVCGYTISSEETPCLSFSRRFDRLTELTGYSELKLYVSAEGADDMDIFVFLEKLNRDGERVIMNYCANKGVIHHMMPNGYSGPSTGRLRVSMRRLDEARSCEGIPEYPFDSPEPLKEGEIAEVRISIPPMGLRFHPGETLRMIISGYDFHGPSGPSKALGLAGNVIGSRHKFYFGGRFDSYLLVPVIPQK